MSGFGDDDIAILLGLDSSLDRDISKAEENLTYLARDRKISTTIDSDVNVKVSEIETKRLNIQTRELAAQNRLLEESTRHQTFLSKEKVKLERIAIKELADHNDRLMSQKQKELQIQSQSDKFALTTAQQTERLEQQTLRSASMREDLSMKQTRNALTLAKNQEQLTQQQIRTADVLERSQARRISEELGLVRKSLQLHYAGLAAEDKRKQSLLGTVKKELQLKKEAVRLEEQRNRKIERFERQNQRDFKKFLKAGFADVKEALKPKGKGFLGRVADLTMKPFTVPANLIKNSVRRAAIGASETLGAELFKNIRAKLKDNLNLDITSTISDFMSDLVYNAFNSQISTNISNLTKDKGRKLFDASRIAAISAIDDEGVKPEAVSAFFKNFLPKAQDIMAVDKLGYALAGVYEAARLVITGDKTFDDLRDELNALTEPLTKMLEAVFKDVNLEEMTSPLTKFIKKFREKELKEVAAILAQEQAQQLLTQKKKLIREDVTYFDEKKGKERNAIDLNAAKIVELNQNLEELIIAVGGWAGMGGASGSRFPTSRLKELIDPNTQAIVGVSTPQNDISGDNKGEMLSSGLEVFLKTNLRGFSDDAVRIASQALAALANNPDLKIKLLGESGGGYPIKEAAEILRILGYGEQVQGLTLGQTVLQLKTIEESLVQEFISIEDEVVNGFRNLMDVGLIKKPTGGLETLGISEHITEGHLSIPELTRFIKGDYDLDVDANQVQESLDTIERQLKMTQDMADNPAFAMMDNTKLIEESEKNARGQLVAFLGAIKELKLQVDEGRITEGKDEIESALQRATKMYLSVSENTKGLEKYYDDITKNSAELDKLIAGNDKGVKVQAAVLSLQKNLRDTRKELINELETAETNIRKNVIDEQIRLINEMQSNIPDFSKFASSRSQTRVDAKQQEKEVKQQLSEQYNDDLIDSANAAMNLGLLNENQIEELQKLINKLVSGDEKGYQKRFDAAIKKLAQNVENKKKVEADLKPVNLNTVKVPGVEDIRDLDEGTLKQIIQQLQRKLEAAKEAEKSGGIVLGGSGAIQGDIRKVGDAIRAIGQSRDKDIQLLDIVEEQYEQLLISLKDVAYPSRPNIETPVQTELFNTSDPSFFTEPRKKESIQSTAKKEMRVDKIELYTNSVNFNTTGIKGQKPVEVSLPDTRQTNLGTQEQLALDFNPKTKTEDLLEAATEAFEVTKNVAMKTKEVTEKSFEVALQIKEKLDPLLDVTGNVAKGAAGGAFEFGRKQVRKSVREDLYGSEDQQLTLPGTTDNEDTRLSGKEIAEKAKKDTMRLFGALGDALNFIGDGAKKAVNIAKKELKDPDVLDAEIFDDFGFSEDEISQLKNSFSTDQLQAIFASFGNSINDLGDLDQAIQQTLGSLGKDANISKLLERLLREAFNRMNFTHSGDDLSNQVQAEISSRVNKIVDELGESLEDISGLIEASKYQSSEDVDTEIKNLGGNNPKLLMPQNTDSLSELNEASSNLTYIIDKISHNSNPEILEKLWLGVKQGTVKIDDFTKQLSVMLVDMQALGSNIKRVQKVRQRYLGSEDKDVQQGLIKTNDAQVKAGKTRSDILKTILKKAPLVKSMADAGNDTAKGFIEGLKKAIPQIEGVANKTAMKYIDEIKDIFEIASPSKLMIRLANWIVNPFQNKLSQIFNIDIADSAKKFIDSLKKDVFNITDLIDFNTDSPEVDSYIAFFEDKLGKASERLQNAGIDLNLKPLATPLATIQGITKGGLQGVKSSDLIKGSIEKGTALLDVGRDTAIDFLDGFREMDEMPKIVKDLAINPTIKLLKAFKPGEIIQDTLSALPFIIKASAILFIAKPFISGLNETRKQVVQKFEDIKKASLQIVSFDPISAGNLHDKSLEISKNLGISADVYAKGQADFLAAGKLIGANSDELIESYDNLVIGLINQGLDTEEINGVIRAQVQSLSKNQLYAEELLQISERLAGTKGLFAQAVGVDVSSLEETLSSGNLDVIDTLDKFNSIIRDRGKYAESESKNLPSRITAKRNSIFEDQIIGKGTEELNLALNNLNKLFTFLLDILSGPLAIALKGIIGYFIYMAGTAIIKLISALGFLSPILNGIIISIGKFAAIGFIISTLLQFKNALTGANSKYKELNDRVDSIIKSQKEFNSIIDKSTSKLSYFGTNIKNVLGSIFSLDVLGTGNNIIKTIQDLMNPGSSKHTFGSGWLINWDQKASKDALNKATELRQSQLNLLSGNISIFDKINAGIGLSDDDKSKAESILSYLQEYLNTFEQYPQVLKDANPEIQKGIDEAKKYITLLTTMTSDDFNQRLKNANRAILLRDIDQSIFDSQVQSVLPEFKITGEVNLNSLVIGDDNELKSQIKDALDLQGENLDIESIELIINQANIEQLNKTLDVYKNKIALQEEFNSSERFNNLKESQQNEKLQEYADTRNKYQDILNKKLELQAQIKQKQFEIESKTFDLEQRKILNLANNKFNNKSALIDLDVIDGILQEFDGQEFKALNQLDLIDTKVQNLRNKEDKAYRDYSSRNITRLDYQDQLVSISEEYTNLLNEQNQQYLEIAKSQKERLRYEREIEKETSRVFNELQQKTLDYREQLHEFLKQDVSNSIDRKLSELERRISLSRKLSDTLSADIPDDETKNQTAIRLAQYKELYRLTGSKGALEASNGKTVKDISKEVSKLFKQQYNLEMELINNKEIAKKKELQFELESLAIAKEKKRLEDLSRVKELKIEAIEDFESGRFEIGNLKLDQADTIEYNSKVESSLFDRKAGLIRDQLVESDREFSFEKSMKRLELLGQLPDKMKPDALKKLIKELDSLGKLKPSENPKYKKEMKEYTKLKEKEPYDSNNIRHQLSNVKNVGIETQVNEINITNNENEINPDISTEILDAIRLFSNTVTTSIQ